MGLSSKDIPICMLQTTLLGLPVERPVCVSTQFGWRRTPRRRDEPGLVLVGCATRAGSQGWRAFPTGVPAHPGSLEGCTGARRGISTMRGPLREAIEHGASAVWRRFGSRSMGPGLESGSRLARLLGSLQDEVPGGRQRW